MDNHFYDDAFSEYGIDDVRSLGWGSKGSQDARFHVLAREASNVVRNVTSPTILDVGCGYGDLLPFTVGTFTRYTGIDARPEAIEVARNKYREPHYHASWHVDDLYMFAACCERTFDVVAASGLFAREDDAPMFKESMNCMWLVCRKALCVNFLKLTDGKQPQPGVYYTTPADALKLITWPCSRITVVGGYLPNDFTVIVER